MIKFTNDSIKNKHILIRKFERKELSEKEYEFELENLNKEINIQTQNILQEEKNKLKEMTEMVEEKKDVKTEEKKIGKKVQKDSVASIIAQVLAMKSIKNVDDAVAKVIEFKPNRDSKKVKSQVSTIIRETEKGKGRWVNYKWDKETFLLTEK